MALHLLPEAYAPTSLGFRQQVSLGVRLYKIGVMDQGKAYPCQLKGQTMEQVQRQCIFEKVRPVELIDAANSLKGHDGISIAVPPPGDGVDKILNWAIADVKMAAQTQGASKRERFAANAILNARRALACLVDWYM